MGAGVCGPVGARPLFWGFWGFYFPPTREFAKVRRTCVRVRTHGQRRKQTPKTPKTPIRASTLINLLRAVLLERGIAVAKGRRHLEEHLKLMLAEDAVPLATLS